MKSYGSRSSDAVLCADYKDLVAPDARKTCPYKDAQTSIATIVTKATAAYEGCLAHAGSVVNLCGGLAAELNRDMEMMGNISAVAAWEACTPDRCAVRLASTGGSVAAGGGTASVGVTAKASDCSWGVSTATSWIHPAAARGMGNGSASVTVDSNPALPRKGSVTIGPRTWIVSQDGEACQYSISPSSISAPPGGARGVIRVEANYEECVWRSAATSGPSMISIWDPSADWADMHGSANMPYNVYANWKATAGGGTITVDKIRIPVTQPAGTGAVLGHIFEAKTLTAGKSYVLEGVVSNPSPVATKGTVVAQFGIPPSVKARSLTGNKWNCRLADLTCTRSDVLLAKGKWSESLSLTVDVAGAVTGDLEVSFTTTVNGVTSDAATSWTQIAFPPVVNSVLSAFDNKAPAAPNVFAPGEAISIYGDRLCPVTEAAALPLPAFLGGCGVKLGDTVLRLYYASPTQINAFIPSGMKSGSANLTVLRDSDPTTANPRWRRTSANYGVQVTSPMPTFLEIPQSGGYNLALQLPSGEFLSASQPMRAGQILTAYLTGLGAMQESVPEDRGPGKAVASAAAVKITIGGAAANVLYAGAQPEFPGLNQITFQVPEYKLAAGAVAVPLTIQVGPVSTAQYTIAAR